MKSSIAMLIVLLCSVSVHSLGQSQESFSGHPPSLLSEAILSAFDTELSGETAKRNLEYISRLHRMRGSEGYHQAASFIAEQLKSYGLLKVRIEQFPIDGDRFYGTQKSRPA